ncbi:MAG: alpha/beta hydrolase [Acidimicrobiales bacterium]|nr:alpha/beta hydrolase [Acidimicrobiales bacterium]
MSTPGPVGGRIENDGIGIAWLDWGGDGDPLVVLHPNGFCAGMYDPLAFRLADHYRVVGVDLRGHGASETVTDEARLGNDAMAGDVIGVLDHLGIDRFALLGVSLGGGVAIIVAAQAPDRVGSLMLCEAIALDPVEREKQGVAFEDAESPLAAGARRRRRVWDDRASVETSYGSRPPLDALDPEVLSAYVRWGFVDRSDGSIELACDPDTEAAIFGTTRPRGPTHSFERLADVRCPTSVLCGSRTDLGTEWFTAQAEVLGVDLQVIDGGHFFLFEDLDRAGSLIRRTFA